MTYDRAAERPEGSVVMRRAALWIGAMLAAGGALATPFAYVPNEQQQLNVIDLGTNARDQSRGRAAGNDRPRLPPPRYR